MTVKLGLQIPNFSYGTGVEQLFPTVIAQAQEAEAAGFDSVFVMDHFYQLPGLGTPDQPMLEAYTTLSGLATATSRIQLSALVTGNTYRNPAVLAKTVFGSPDQVADQIKTKVLDAGVDGVILSPITSLNGYQPGAVTAVAEKLKPLLTVDTHR